MDLDSAAGDVRRQSMWGTMARLSRVVLAAALLLLAGSINSWETSDDIGGTIRVSSVASFLTVTASIESEGDYEEDFRIDLLLSLSAETEGDECLDLTVIVRDDTGEMAAGTSTPQLEDCNVLALGPSAEACAGQLPGRCDVTFEVEVSSPEELELSWLFEASVMGNLHCNQDQPPTTVNVSQ